ncbi:unknown [Prevotella sp. CAG:891]|nr:unknown [Prevotella sp. CAG:891]
MGCISLLIVRCAVLTTNLIRVKIHSSPLSSFQAGTSVWGTYLGVFLKTLIISNSEILETGSELIQTSSELI